MRTPVEGWESCDRYMAKVKVESHVFLQDEASSELPRGHMRCSIADFSFVPRLTHD